MRDVLLLDERITADGTVARTWADVDGARFVLSDDRGAIGALPFAAVERVMARFGRALDPEIEVVEGDVLVLGDRRLRRLRYHAIVDAEGRDYLVWERPGAEPLAGIATTVTAALRHLATHLAPRPPSDS
jgi:hypothetical protein